MRHKPKTLTHRRGTAAVELAFVLPILLVLLYGVWEVGRLIELQQIMSNAAREGGRQAALGIVTNAQIQTDVMNYLKNAGVPTQNATVTVTNVTEPGVDASQAAQMDQLTVTVTVPVQDFSWIMIGYIIPSGSNLSSQAVWYSMQNTTYPAPADPPINY
jgi:Flp pilus assembly protein TadG